MSTDADDTTARLKAAGFTPDAADAEFGRVAYWNLPGVGRFQTGAALAILDLVEAKVATEREACARIAEEAWTNHACKSEADAIAAAIRARSIA